MASYLTDVDSGQSGRIDIYCCIDSTISDGVQRRNYIIMKLTKPKGKEAYIPNLPPILFLACVRANRFGDKTSADTI